MNATHAATLPLILLTWPCEHTDYSPEIIEAALAHKQADRVVVAYARNYLDRRREVMEEWGRYCVGG